MNISGRRVIHILMVLCLRPAIGLTLSFISKSSQNGSGPNVEVVLANVDTILVAINMRSNMNINEGN